MSLDVYAGSVGTAPVYTAPGKRESVRSRAGRGKWWIVGIGLVVILAISVALTSRPTDYRALSIDNSTDNGARATAQILRGQGVDVRQYDTLARVPIAEASSTTLVIAGAVYLSDAQIESLLAYPGDIVFMDVFDELVEAIDPGLEATYSFLPETVAAACANPDATAAETMRVEFSGLQRVGSTDAELCFANRSDVFGMAVVPSANGNRTIMTNPLIYTNGALLTDGNAALALRTAGHHENLAWYLGSYSDSTLLAGPGGPTHGAITADVLPPGFGTAVYALALAALVGALWKGRRFGPLAAEPLPVVVRASEATRGRARLYRRAHAYGRATAALRAASARRIGARLGVPRTTDREGMVAAIQRATGESASEIAKILYGPPPASEAEMTTVVDQLDALEGKVHRT